MEKRLQTLIPTAQILEQQYHEERYRLQLYQKEIRNVEEQLMYGPTPCHIRTGTGPAPCLIGTGTVPTSPHICAGT